MRPNTSLRAVAALAVPILLGTAGTVHAKPCNDPSIVNPIYGLGGSSSKPLLAKLSQALASLPAPNTATIVFQAPGACTGIYALVNGTTITGTASYWDATGVEQSCDLPAAGQVIDFANMGNSAALCPQAPSPLPDTIGDYQGPVNNYDFIVPVGSSQSSISAAGAYFVFGFGAAGQASPWINEAEIIIRDQNSAVQQLIGSAIGVSADKWKYGVNGASQSGVIAKVGSATDPEAAIGVISGESADGARATVKVLAYQHYGQSCGYLPDSSNIAHDRKNVRDGHYFIWTPQHFFALKDPTTGVITSPGARQLIGYFTGAVPLPAGVDLIKIEASAGTIPECAMHVWRTGDLGDLQTHTPAKACNGYFESLTGGTTAKACPNGPTDCTSEAPACNYGYCEVQ